MSDVKVERVMETDENGVARQIYPITHVSAVEGLNMEGTGSSVKSVNGKSGHVNITLNDLGVTDDMLDKLNQIIIAFDSGQLGNGTIELEKIKEEENG